MSILFHSLYPCKNLPPKAKIKKWLTKIISDHEREPGHINIIFVDDEKILELNRKFLNHNYLTDILTFDYNKGILISGDIYISIMRVTDNAEKFNCNFREEILRVIIHGIFHLLGFDDKTKNQKSLMRNLENLALSEFYTS